MGYYKQIEISSTVLITASVYCNDGRRTALKFFGTGVLDILLNSSKRVERNCLKAHKWADEMIEVCEKHEVIE